MLAGYLLFRVVTVWRAEAAPAALESPEAATGALPTEGLCTAEGLREFLERTASVTEDDIELAYEHCRDQFLERNELSPVVKQTVDQWVGTDLSKAETNQIFLAYELAFVGPRPDHLPEGFEPDCRRMVDQFQEFRDLLEPLISRVEIDLSSLLADGLEEVDEDERQLLNFVQYAQFCKSLLNHHSLVSDNELEDEMEMVLSEDEDMD